jgi:hypothetical protein
MLGDLYHVSDALPYLKPYLHLVVRSLDVLMLKDLSYLRFLACKSGHKGGGSARDSGLTTEHECATCAPHASQDLLHQQQINSLIVCRGHDPSKQDGKFGRLLEGPGILLRQA